MKPIQSPLSILFLLLASTLPLHAQNVSKYILELETHTKWDAVDSRWNSVRNQWVSDCNLDNIPENSARLLLQFESYLKWEAVDQSWSSRRNAWIEEGQAALVNASVARLLLELESNIKWAAVDDSWKQRRDGWVSELKRIAQNSVAVNASYTPGQLSTPTVTIGTQTWMTSNLDVSHFRNGDTIPEVRTAAAWKQANDNHQPAWCYYDNNPANGRRYGKLYNWYAVTSPKQLAPEGWHIPSDAEWMVLGDFLGGADTAAFAMKTTSGWNDGGNGSNESGFSALPGGYRFYDQSFSNLGEYGYWWSSNLDNSGGLAKVRHINQYNGILWERLEWIEEGLSVRCIKD